MAKKRKKYDKNKTAKFASDFAANKSMLIQVQGLGRAGKIWILQNRPVPADAWLKGGRSFDYRFTFLTPQQWTIVAGVACRSPLGDNYFKYSQQSAFNKLIYHDPEIQHWIMEYLADTISETNKEHILTTFFFALPKQREFTTEEVDKILNWLNVYDPENILTAYEKNTLNAELKKEISQNHLTLEDYLPKPTATLLKKNNITDLLTLFWIDEEQLNNMKGIGEKRLEHISTALKRLAKENEKFYILAKDSYRREESKKFILEDQKNSEEFYQFYLEKLKK